MHLQKDEVDIHILVIFLCTGTTLFTQPFGNHIFAYQVLIIITDPHVLVLQRLYQNDIFARHATSVEDINKSQRYAAYTQFTLFKYGKLGAHDRRAVPSYCTWFIRNKLPDPNGHYIENVPIW